MSDSMNQPVTRGELREQLATKADKSDLVPLATRAELDLWGGALLERIKEESLQLRREMATKTYVTEAIAELATKPYVTEAIAAAVTEISADLARHAGAIMEQTRFLVGVFDENYRDIPPRVTKLEAHAHTHPTPEPPRSQSQKRPRARKRSA